MPKKPLSTATKANAKMPNNVERPFVKKHGVPTTVMVDNAYELGSSYFSALEALGIKVVFAPTSRPVLSQRHRNFPVDGPVPGSKAKRKS